MRLDPDTQGAQYLATVVRGDEEDVVLLLELPPQGLRLLLPALVEEAPLPEPVRVPHAALPTLEIVLPRLRPVESHLQKNMMDPNLVFLTSSEEMGRCVFIYPRRALKSSLKVAAVMPLIWGEKP